MDALWGAWAFNRQDWVLAAILALTCSQQLLYMVISRDFYQHGWRHGRAALFTSMHEAWRYGVPSEAWIESELDRPPVWPKP